MSQLLQFEILLSDVYCRKDSDYSKVANTTLIKKLTNPFKNVTGLQELHNSVSSSFRFAADCMYKVMDRPHITARSIYAL